MKLRSLLAAGAAMLVSASAAHAADGTANATATVSAALSVTKQADLRFGGFTPGTSGTGTINATSGSTTNGVVKVGNTNGPAQFLVTGTPGNAYTVSVPAPGAVSLTGPVGATPMPVTFSADVASIEPLNGAGTDSFNVGGILTVNANQTAGSYTAPFTVTVDYQ